MTTKTAAVDYATCTERELERLAEYGRESEMREAAEAELQRRAEELTVEAQLKAQGLRKASVDEAGWYAMVLVTESGERVASKVWATNLD